MNKMGANDLRSPLEITELLEQVLLHLSQGEILQLQRVSHFWLHTISKSPSLQQKLFFQPLPPPKAAGRPPQFNPIVETLFPYLFRPQMYPFLISSVTGQEAENLIQHWAEDPARRQAVLRAEASWRLMLPVQPAAPIDGVLKAWWDWYWDWNWSWDGNGDDARNGLEWCEVDASRHASVLASKSDLGSNATMGLLYDIILHYFDSDWNHMIFVQWNMFHFPREYGPEAFRRNALRNAITIHVTPPFGHEFTMPVTSPGLRKVIDLPAGVIRASDKANRYPGGNRHGEYTRWGTLSPELESELDREQRQLDNERRESEVLALH